MKQKLLKLLTAILCVPAILFCGCSQIKSDLKTINLSTYYSDKVVCSTYGKSKTSTLSLTDFTSKEPRTNLIGQYTEFEVQANGAWMYKMYIDYIYFYVYTNIATDYQMTVNVSLTNLADESNLQNPTDDFSKDCSLIPKENGKFLCEVEVKKVVPTATGTTLTIDILNTIEVFTDIEGKDSGFKWMIYGLEFYAESRAYSK